MGKQLIVISGLERGRVLPLQDADVIQLGCSQTLEVLARFRDPEMARVHCEVQVEGERVIVHDADTPNGTYLNGRRIVQQELRPGDVIRIGRTELKFICGDTFHPKPQSFPSLDLADTQSKPLTKTDILIEEPSSKLRTASPSNKGKVTAEHLNLLVGRTFVHYKIVSVLGSGHWGRVFRGQDQRVANTVALKILCPEFAEHPEALQQFGLALKIVLPIQHPNLITYLGAGKAGPFPWIAMEYVEGKSLTQIIRRMQTTGILDWRQSVSIALQIARALDVAHLHQLRHGNLTPQSVMIRDADKQAKLGGLLLAKALEEIKEQPPGGLKEQVDDTPYMSPERTYGLTDVDIRSDLYSLGTILYALITGRPPFEAANPGETVRQIRNDEPIKPKKYQPLIHNFYEETVLKMLAKDPRERPQNPAELLARLEKLATWSGVQANLGSAN
jgi:serine/threonine protein kinase